MVGKIEINKTSFIGLIVLCVIFFLLTGFFFFLFWSEPVEIENVETYCYTEEEIDQELDELLQDWNEGLEIALHWYGYYFGEAFMIKCMEQEIDNTTCDNILTRALTDKEMLEKYSIKIEELFGEEI